MKKTKVNNVKWSGTMPPNEKTVIFSDGTATPNVFDDAYSSYMAKVTIYPRLSREREIKLSRIIRKSRNKKNVESAIQEYVEGNLLLVVKCAIDYYKKYVHMRGIPLTLMDLIAEGNCGLLKAVKLYNSDHKAHAKFGTYAVMSILQSIRRAVQNATLIHIPVNHYSYWPDLGRLREKYGEDVSDEIVAKELNIPVSVARNIKEAKNAQPMMLESNPMWENVFPDKSSTDSDVNMRELGRYLLAIMNEILTSREKLIVYELYLSGNDPTYDKVSSIVGVSRERVRQISVVAMRKMRRRIVGDWESISHRMGDKVPICIENPSSKDRKSTKRMLDLKVDLVRGGDFDRRDMSVLASMLF